MRKLITAGAVGVAMLVGSVLPAGAMVPTPVTSMVTQHPTVMTPTLNGVPMVRYGPGYQQRPGDLPPLPGAKGPRNYEGRRTIWIRGVKYICYQYNDGSRDCWEEMSAAWGHWS